MSSGYDTRPLSFSRLLLAFVLLSVLTVASYALTAQVLLPVQQTLFGAVPVAIVAIFLPQGVKVIATWMLGWLVVPMMLPAVILSTNLFGSPDVSEPVQLLFSMVWLVSAPLAFDLLRMAGIDIAHPPRQQVSWRILPVIGVLASVLNTVFDRLFLPTAAGPALTFVDTFRLIVADFFGVLAVLMFAMAYFRWWRVRHPA